MAIRKRKETSMAKDDKPNDASFIGRVVGDPANPPETRLLTGWLGDAGEAGYKRLYTDAELSSYVDIPEDAILYTEPIRDVQPAGGVFVWVRRDAALKQGGSAASRAGRFLQGQVAQDFSSPQKAGMRCVTQEPCGEVTGFTGQCTKQPELGGGWPCITAFPLCSAEPTGFSGQCTHQPWPNPTHYIGCTVLHCPTNDLTHQPQICNIVASGIPGCGGFVPPQGGDDPKKSGADAQQVGAEAPVPPQTNIPGCGYTKSWGLCETHLLGCGFTKDWGPNCPPETNIPGCGWSRNPICTDLPGCGWTKQWGLCNDTQAPKCQPSVQIPCITQDQACNVTRDAICIDAQGIAGGAVGARNFTPGTVCTQFGPCRTRLACTAAGEPCTITEFGPRCRTVPNGDCTFFGCFPGGGGGGGNAQFGAPGQFIDLGPNFGRFQTVLRRDCFDIRTLSAPHCLQTRLEPRCFHVPVASPFCPRTAGCPFDDRLPNFDPRVFGGGVAGGGVAFGAAAPESQICATAIGCDITTIECLQTHFIPQCNPSAVDACPTRIGCDTAPPTQFCTQTPEGCPTWCGPHCQSHAPCTPVNCTHAGPQCPPHSVGIACTALPPQCPPETNVILDCTFGCTQVGTGCNTNVAVDCHTTAVAACNTINAVGAAQPAAAAGAAAQVRITFPVFCAPTPATRCFICPPLQQTRWGWQCPQPSPWFCTPPVSVGIACTAIQCGGGGGGASAVDACPTRLCGGGGFQEQPQFFGAQGGGGGQAVAQAPARNAAFTWLLSVCPAICPMFPTIARCPFPTRGGPECMAIGRGAFAQPAHTDGRPCLDPPFTSFCNASAFCATRMCGF